MSAARNFFGDLSLTAGVTLVRMAGAALSFALVVVLSARLGPADAGVFYASLAWATAIVILALWGAPQLVLHLVPPLLHRPRRAAAGPALRTLLLGNLVRLLPFLLVALLAGTMLGPERIRSAAGVDIVFVCAVAAALLFLRSICSAAKALGLPGRATFAEFVAVPGGVLLALALVLRATDISLQSATTLYAAMLVLAVLFGFLALWPAVPGCRTLRGGLPRPWRMRRTVFAHIELGQFLAAVGAIAFLPIVLAPDDVGVVNLVLRIAGLVGLVSATVPAIFLPRLAAAQGAGDTARFEAVLLTMRIVMGLAGLTAFAAILVLGPAILSFAGPEYTGGQGALPWASAGFCLALALGPVATQLTLMGHERFVRNSVLPAGIGGVAASVLVGWIWGPSAAAAMPGAAVVAAALAQLVALRTLRAKDAA